MKGRTLFRYLSDLTTFAIFSRVLNGPLSIARLISQAGRSPPKSMDSSKRISIIPLLFGVNTHADFSLAIRTSFILEGI